jgi:hypothetical protein
MADTEKFLGKVDIDSSDTQRCLKLQNHWVVSACPTFRHPKRRMKIASMKFAQAINHFYGCYRFQI